MSHLRLLPRPVAARSVPGEFPLDAATTITAPGVPATTAAWLHAFPRLCAVAEALWCGPDRRDFDDFSTRLYDAHLPRLDAIGVEYRPRTGPLPWHSRPGIVGAPATKADREAHMNRRVAAIRS
ncbi:hypothetical protein ACFU98_24975 [Streptomyces sp. NPDC057575]|uniref:hypothetical protein n=1 Tax=unclassified Streptomyces TaxID=2593676 RepID=UPI0036B8A377